MKSVSLEYGDSNLDIQVADHATVLESGVTHTEPSGVEDPVAETKAALANPLNMPPIRDLVGAGSRVVIAFPDRVKGGSHPTAHRRVAIPLILDELAAAGVRDRDIRLVCAIGLHRKNTDAEFESYLGPDIAARFRGLRLVNHDPEDPDGIADLGETDAGDRVEVNRAVVEADLTISIGHVMGNPYGGYSGGYKMPCTGLTTWRSIRAHHTPGTMHRPDFVPASNKSHFRRQLTAIGQRMESHMKQPFFCVDAVLNATAQQTAVFAGAAGAVEDASWQMAAKRTEVELPGDTADVLVIGMPRNFHYGPGMGSNPILMLQAIGSSLVRAGAALSREPVVICASVCDGWFNDRDFAPYPEVYDRFQECANVREMAAFEDDMANRDEYRHKFRYAYSYHPFHAFSMLYMGGIALERARAIYIVGAKAPGYARGMGTIPVRTFEDAMQHAVRYVGSDPSMLVVPALSKPALHPRVPGGGGA